MSTSKYLVVTPHVSEFPAPIIFKKGAFLTVGEKYEGKADWENWFFCSAPGQEPGWVPGQIIEFLDGSTGRALDDYTARELNVEQGELLVGKRELNGWLWCEKADDTEPGWVPLENLKKVDD
ncbi:hypothetical protein [Billgrantia aerodenitrificans]|uniref:SH3 domain-containing protein n=1 Tax=Billgrantia aerodenitrificans TaxID=2733483 RepID=A0ABS9AS58_9GAMM|nr:hypothetical protein [Halomonas aerodenitrificans]MCE8024527.1 hypothetical protein [Halomonas aerodenitrificans]